MRKADQNNRVGGKSMAESKTPIGIDVLTAARQRISHVFDTFSRICVSFSGGKDSSVMLHLVMDEAIKRGRKVGVLFIDLEAQYQLTIAHVAEMFSMYTDHIEPYWVALPISLRNAVSQYEPKWKCWDTERIGDWVRNPPEMAIVDHGYFPFFVDGMEFEEFVPRFGEWFSGGELTACLVGIRSDESLNRWRTIKSNKKARFEGLCWTTYVGGTVYNAYPIYDWQTRDIWIYNGKECRCHNHLYNRMQAAGLSIHQQRICQPYGDDQRKGLWLFHVIEPDTWSRIVARVNGANSGALYARDRGNINGNIRVTLPEGHSWESFAKMLLSSMPPAAKQHYEDKIATFLHWWRLKGHLIIPDHADPKEEAARNVPSWRRICKTLLRNDYWCKGLSFTQTKSDAYDRYKQLMRARRARWGMNKI